MRTISKEHISALEKEIIKQICKKSYADYVEYVHDGLYKHAKHTRFICNLLQKSIENGSKRIIINLPPRHSKSMTITETFPSFFLGNFPNKSVITVAYGDDLADRFGRYNRQKVNVYGKEIFDISVSREKASVTEWSIAGHRGGMRSVGIGGSITGHGADLMIIDDPVKNWEQATSR